MLGDLFLDRYLDIDPALDEPSVETGLTAYQVVRVRQLPRRGRHGHQQPRGAGRRPHLPDRRTSATTARGTSCGRPCGCRRWS